MGYTHEFSCDRCGEVERNTTGDCTYRRIEYFINNNLWACPKCLSQYELLEKLSAAAWKATAYDWANLSVSEEE